MFQARKLYLPALVIVGVVLALLVFIGFSTYWNMNRARRHSLMFVHQQGAAILQALEAGGRSMTDMSDNPAAAIDRLLTETGRNADIAYIYVVSREGAILNRSTGFSRSRDGVWHPDIENPRQIVSHFRKTVNAPPIYELAKLFAIYPPKSFAASPHRSAGSSFQDVSFFKRYAGADIVIGLKMTTFATARRQDLQHAVIMVSILVILAWGAVFFIFVINRYHRMNRQLKETQDYTQQVVDSMANGLLSIDPSGRILSYNSLGLELLGVSESDISKLRLDRVLDFQASGISRTLADNCPVMDREILLHGPNGEEMPLGISVTPIMTQDGICNGAVIILRDLREIKQLEEKVRRSEKLAALGKLAAAVAHEIRNPLSSIRGFAQFLSHALKDRPTDRDYAMVMVKEVDRINRVVTDLLNFARPLELELSVVDPAGLIDHTVRLLEGDAASRGIVIRKHLPSAQLSVKIDANLITQVLLNLVLNALQAVDDGHVVDVGVEMEAGGSHVRFWVEDNGHGIPAEDQQKIFDPFFTTREKGTGLGLAIVQKIVENHHGTIRLESPPEGRLTGCRFSIRIPVDANYTDKEQYP